MGERAHWSLGTCFLDAATIGSLPSLEEALQHEFGIQSCLNIKRHQPERISRSELPPKVNVVHNKDGPGPLLPNRRRASVHNRATVLLLLPNNFLKANQVLLLGQSSPLGAHCYPVSRGAGSTGTAGEAAPAAFVLQIHAITRKMPIFEVCPPLPQAPSAAPACNSKWTHAVNVSNHGIKCHSQNYCQPTTRCGFA